MATIIHGLSSWSHSASRNQSIKIYSTDSDELVNTIRYHDGFMGQKIGPTRCLAFHPYKVKIPISIINILLPYMNILLLWIYTVVLIVSSGMASSWRY